MLGLMYIFALSFSIDHEVFSGVNFSGVAMPLELLSGVFSRL